MFNFTSKFKLMLADEKGNLDSSFERMWGSMSFPSRMEIKIW